MSDLRPEDLEGFDPDLLLAKLNRWADLGGDETGPPEDWTEALDLMERAFDLLAEVRDPAETVVAFTDVYAAVILHRLS